METSQQAIQVGDQVQLKSGGPTMTVNAFNVFGHCICVWFDGTANKEATYSKAALKLADDEQK